MRLGIGTGSTAEAFVRLLAERVEGGLKVIGVPTSERTAALCLKLGVPLVVARRDAGARPHHRRRRRGRRRARADQGRRRRAAARKDRGGRLAADDRDCRPLEAGRRRSARFPLPIEVNRFGLKATELAIGRAAAALGLSGPLTLQDARRRAFRHRRRTFHHRCIFWPHSRSKSAVGCAPRNSGGRGAWPVPRHGVRRDPRRPGRHRNTGPRLKKQGVFTIMILTSRVRRTVSAAVAFAILAVAAPAFAPRRTSPNRTSRRRAPRWRRSRPPRISTRSCRRPPPR